MSLICEWDHGIDADINIHPKVLNLKSKGKRIISWINPNVVKIF